MWKIGLSSALSNAPGMYFTGKKGGLPSTWFAIRKKRIAFMLKQGVTYISSDESGDEGDTSLHSRPIPWLRKKYLVKLDKMYFSGLSVKSKRLLKSRVQGRPSNRPIPTDAPSYLLRDIANTSTNSEDIA